MKRLLFSVALLSLPFVRVQAQERADKTETAARCAAALLQHQPNVLSAHRRTGEAGPQIYLKLRGHDGEIAMTFSTRRYSIGSQGEQAKEFEAIVFTVSPAGADAAIAVNSYRRLLAEQCQVRANTPDHVFVLRGARLPQSPPAAK